jgi:poly-beta-1,6-N-acetyl-D-glucosamine synthase
MSEPNPPSHCSANLVKDVQRNGKTSGNPRYAIVTPVRDEEAYIGAMIESIATQTILPEKWIIVDDGSSDKTVEIVESYARRFKFIKLLQLPTRDRRRPGGEEAIPSALRLLDVNKFEYLARYDADLSFSPDYIERIMNEFKRDPLLGIAGGGLYIDKGGKLEFEKNPEYHVRGALKMYRRECFESIGGLTTQIGWDTVDEVSAWTKGWRTRSFYDLKVIHRRPTGEGIETGRIYRERGRAEYLTCSHPLFVLAKTLRLAVTRRSILKPLCYLKGFVASYLRHEKRICDPAFAKARRDQQIGRLFDVLLFRKRESSDTVVSASR